MSDGGTAGSWVSRAIRACFSILLAAIALYLAVDIIRSIWPWLVGGIGVFVGLAGTVQLWRLIQQSRW